MKKIYSKKDPSKLLHIINRFNEINERTNIVSDEQFIQLATMRLNAGKTFPPHKHIWKDEMNLKVIAQESWVVIQGSVCVHFYDIDETYLGDEIIEQGDCSITLEGGHTYTILKDDTVVYEYKTGPYYGQKLDKILINDHRLKKK
tara:strand:+ start:90 stop:524 length:435 start_codon:yes stop_codon:yes gene_type:complete